MLKAVIFDDEYIVLEGLQKMIDWSRYGIELAGTAQDGNSALSLFLSCQPDIVFTDIRMPSMNGLELIERMLRLKPQTHCIVFSGFNEYDYVKRAIKLGVTDYLEKPVTLDKIDEALQKALARIHEQEAINAMKSEWERSRVELLEKATLDLLLQGKEAEAKWRRSFGADGDRIKGVTVFASSSSFTLDVTDWQDCLRIVQVRNGSDKLHIVFHFYLPQSDFWNSIRFQAADADVYVGSGRTYFRVAEADESFREALQALKYGRFICKKGLTQFEDLGMNPEFPPNTLQLEENILLMMQSGNMDGMKHQLQRLLDAFKQANPHPKIVSRELLKLIYLGKERMKKGSYADGGESKDDYYPHIEIEEMNTLEDMFHWLNIQLQKIAQSSDIHTLSHQHPAVHQALHYIRTHYDQELSLQQVAAHVGMNPAYFSVLFKEEMGVTYIRYLTRYRMERAKEMLRAGKTVTEVSHQVGYWSYRHFTETFKKLIGLSPGQYKDVAEREQSQM